MFAVAFKKYKPCLFILMYILMYIVLVHSRYANYNILDPLTAPRSTEKLKKKWSNMANDVKQEPS